MKKLVTVLMLAAGTMICAAGVHAAAGHGRTVTGVLRSIEGCNGSINGSEGSDNPNFEVWWVSNPDKCWIQVAGKCRAYKGSATVWMHGVGRTRDGNPSEANCDDSVSYPVQMNANVSNDGGRRYGYCEMWPVNRC